MPTPIEILYRARADTSAAFKQVIGQLEGVGKEAKKTNDLLSKIGDDLKGKLGSAAEGAAGKLGGLGSTLTALGPGGIAAAAAIGTVVAAIGAVVKVSADAALAAAAYGDKILDLAGKTDLSAKSLQAFDVMARTGNTTVEAIAAATLKMGRNIVDGSDAFRRLGLDINKLKSMSPEEQFRAVAVAIEGLGTNAERSAARVAIFGKSGDELTTVLHEAATGATELSGALSDEALQASADLQDQVDLLKTAWERVILQFGAAIAKSPELQKALGDLTGGVVKLAEMIEKAAPKIAAFFSNFANGLQGAASAAKAGGGFISDLFSGKGVLVAGANAAGKIAGDLYMQGMKDSINKLKHEVGFGVKGKGVLGGQGGAFGPSASDLKKAQDERRRAIEEENKLREKTALGWDAFYKTLFKEESDLTKWVQSEAAAREKARAKELLDGLEANRKAVADQKAVNAAAWEEKKKQYAEDQAAARQLREDMAAGAAMLADIFQDLGLSADNAFVKVLQGFASGIQAANDFRAATNNAQKAMAAMGAVQSALGGGVFGGATTGATFGAQFGPVGAAIGAVGGALLGLFGKGKAAREEMEKLRNEFVKGAGGMDALAARAKAAGVSLDGMFRKKSADALARQIDTIKRKLQEWDDAQQILKDGQEKWNIAIGDMGPKFAGLELDKRAHEMVLFFAAAGQVGANMDAVTAGMAKDVNDLVAQYQAAGLAIPAAMRPMLEAMLKNGDLVDENGVAYESLEAAGITFAETMEGALSKVGDEIRKLMEVLARGFNIPINFEVSGAPEGGGGTGGMGGNHPPRDEGVPEFANAFIPHRPGGTLGKVGERTDEYAIEGPQLQQLIAGAISMAGAHNGGSAGGITVNVPVSISNREFGSVQANVSRRRQGRQSPSGIRRF